MIKIERRQDQATVSRGARHGPHDRQQASRAICSHDPTVECCVHCCTWCRLRPAGHQRGQVTGTTCRTAFSPAVAVASKAVAGTGLG